MQTIALPMFAYVDIFVVVGGSSGQYLWRLVWEINLNLVRVIYCRQRHG